MSFRRRCVGLFVCGCVEGKVSIRNREDATHYIIPLRRWMRHHLQLLLYSTPSERVIVLTVAQQLSTLSWPKTTNKNRSQ